MKTKYLALLALLTLFACNDDHVEKVEVFISNGKLQCQDNAISVSTTESYLTRANIRVLDQSCGIINAKYLEVCGGETGQIHTYSIEKSDVNSATNIGFTDISMLAEGYQTVACDSL